MIKYTKQAVDKELLKFGMSNTWSNNKKRKFILEIFETWNAKTTALHDREELKEAEAVLELCATALAIYKSKPHKRKYTKTVKKKSVKKKRKPRKKKAVKKSDNGGCLVPIVMLLSSASLFIFCILYFF